MNRKDVYFSAWYAVFTVALSFSGALALSKLEGMPLLSHSVKGLVQFQEAVVLVLGVLVIVLLLFARRRA